jgi:hypothetical protein
VGKPEGERPPVRPRCRWEGNIKMDLRETGWGGTDWITLAEDKDRWRVLVNMRKLNKTPVRCLLLLFLPFLAADRPYAVSSINVPIIPLVPSYAIVYQCIKQSVSVFPTVTSVRIYGSK